MTQQMLTLIDRLPKETLSFNTAGVTAVDGVANVLSNVLSFQVPEGEVIAFTPEILPILDLNASAGTRIARYGKIGLAFIPAGGDPDRPIPIGSRMHSYTRAFPLTTTLQGHSDYRDRLKWRLTRKAPVLVFNQDDTILIQVLSEGVTDVSESQIELPCHRGRPGAISTELALRVNECGW